MDYQHSDKGEIKNEVIEKNEFADLSKKNEFAIQKKDATISKYLEKKRR